VCPVQSFPTIVVDGSDLDDMGQKELSAQLERLAGRVTALEKKLNSLAKNAPKGKWGIDRWIAFGILAFTIIGLPIIVTSIVEPHLHSDLKADVKIEVADQLKEPLRQIGEIAGDVREIKGKLEVLDPLIREVISKKLRGANLSPKELKDVV
jgi:hypothetical protein